MEALEKAISVCGSQAALAALIGVKQQNIWNWLHRPGGVPHEYGPAIELETAARGQPILCEDLCPTDPWSRIPDINWPLTAGRPVIDHAATALLGQAEQGA